MPGLELAELDKIIAIVSVLQLQVFGSEWELHSMVGGALFMIVGTQVLALGLCAHAYGTYFLGDKDPWFDRMRARFRLEHGLMLGGATMLVGLLVGGFIVVKWIDRGFGELSEERLMVGAATLIIVGVQVFFSSFLLSILGLRKAR